MALSVVQTASFGGEPNPLNFSSNVTAGNTVFLTSAAYATSGSPCSCNAGYPTLNNATVTGTIAFFNNGTTGGVNSASDGGNVAFTCMWMLPNVPGGVNGLRLPINSGNNNLGCVAWEVSGLGASPVLDQSSPGSGITTGTADSGTTPAITAAPEIILGASMLFSGGGASSPSGYTVTHPSGDVWAGYQIATSSGGTYHWTQTGSGAPWASLVVTVAAALVPAGSGALLPVTTV